MNKTKAAHGDALPQSSLPGARAKVSLARIGLPPKKVTNPNEEDSQEQKLRLARDLTKRLSREKADRKAQQAAQDAERDARWKDDFERRKMAIVASYQIKQTARSRIPHPRAPLKLPTVRPRSRSLLRPSPSLVREMVSDHRGVIPGDEESTAQQSGANRRAHSVANAHRPKFKASPEVPKQDLTDAFGLSILGHSVMSFKSSVQPIKPSSVAVPVAPVASRPPSSPVPTVSPSLPVPPTVVAPPSRPRVVEGMELVPVDVDIEGMKEEFEMYFPLIEPSIAKSTEGWKGIESIVFPTSSAEWFWIKSIDPSDDVRYGLAIFRLKKGGVAHVIHLSAISIKVYPLVLSALRQYIMSHTDATAVRINVWLDQLPEGKFGTNPFLDAAFVLNKFRWFQLTNGIDGSKGQVMNSRRDENIGDCQILESNLNNFTLSIRQVDIAVLDVPDPSPRHALSFAVGNRVCLADALRRAPGSPKSPSSPTSGGPPSPISEEATAEDRELAAALKIPSARDHPLTAVLELRDRLQGISISSVASKVLPDLNSALHFASDYTSFDYVQNPKWSSAISAELQGLESKPQKLLVGCLNVQVDIPIINEKVARGRAGQTGGRVLIPVQALAKSGDSNIYYIATDSDDTFAFLIPAPDLSSSVNIFSHTERLLKGATKVEESDVSYIRLPSFTFENMKHTDAYTGMPATRRLAARRLYELTQVSVGHVRGRRPVGALRCSVVEENVFNVVGQFLFGIWNTSIDELEIPLFVSLVDTDCWTREGSPHM